jgi:hypothetical protein
MEIFFNILYSKQPAITPTQSHKSPLCSLSIIAMLHVCLNATVLPVIGVTVISYNIQLSTVHVV